MAHDIVAVADMVADALDVGHDEISDLLDASPFFARLPVVGSSAGDVHKYSKETGAPVVGFRAENTGIDIDHSVDTIVTVNLKILDASSWVDQAVANRWQKGGWRAWVEREMKRHLKAAFFQAEKQYIQGTNNDASGFTGFEDAAGLDALADTMVIDAEGTTASTGSSCYLIREGTETGVAGVMIEDNPLVIGETTSQSKEQSSKTLQVYNTPCHSWIALQIGGAYSIARIANLTADAGKGLTDDLIYEAMSKFPIGRGPTVAICSKRSLEQLRASRTATNPTGSPAPTPTEVGITAGGGGIPIMALESISDTETLLT